MPVDIPFVQYYRVSEGYTKAATLEIWHDENTSTAPIHPTAKVKNFAKLEADLEPDSEFRDE